MQMTANFTVQHVFGSLQTFYGTSSKPAKKCFVEKNTSCHPETSKSIFFLKKKNIVVTFMYKK